MALVFLLVGDNRCIFFHRHILMDVVGSIARPANIRKKRPSHAGALAFARNQAHRAVVEEMVHIQLIITRRRLPEPDPGNMMWTTSHSIQARYPRKRNYNCTTAACRPIVAIWPGSRYLNSPGGSPRIARLMFRATHSACWIATGATSERLAVAAL